MSRRARMLNWINATPLVDKVDIPYINRSVLIFSFLNPFGGNNARIVDSKIAHNGFALGIAQWRGGLS